jgi:predicted MFS family arabinose efflux permease
MRLDRPIGTWLLLLPAWWAIILSAGGGPGVNDFVFVRWVLFGIGAVLGPLVSGQIADRIGFAATLRLAFVIQAIAVLIPAFDPNAVALMLSSFVVGAFTPGIVPIVLGRVHELLPHAPAQQKAAWSRATTSFAVLQAAAAYGMSYLFAHDGGNYALLFALAASATLLALLIDLAVGRSRR